MKRVFVSAGTSLFDRSLLGVPEAFLPLRDRSAVAAWDEAADEQDAIELSAGEAETKLSAALAAAGMPDLDDLPQRIRLLREAFELGGHEEEKKMLPAELASLCRLLPRYPLASGDHLVILATDSPQGHLVGRVLHQVLAGHPELAGADVELAQPRHWQAHDGLRLAEHGAANLLAAVSRRIASDLRARPLFVLTGGLKLGITILSQVSCWSQADGHDGLFLKLEDPGGVFFPPCSFVEHGNGCVLLPRLPTTEALRREVAFTAPLRSLAEAVEPPRRTGARPLTTLVVTVGVGLVRARPKLLEARFGSSPLAAKTTWDAIDQYALCRSWEELRSEMDGVPSDEDLVDAVEGVASQLRDAWNAGRSADLPSELAVLRSLWGDGEPAPTPLLRGHLRVVLLATDSLTGEFCASLVAGFLQQVEGVAEVVHEAVPGFHPFGGLERDGAFVTHMAEIVADAAGSCERLLIMPLGGTKLHLPLLTTLATRLHAPLVLGHVGLDRPVVIPWLESDGGRVRGAGGVGEAWPELASFPTVRLEVEGG